MYSIICINTSNLFVVLATKNHTPLYIYHSWLLIVNVKGFPFVNICMVKHVMKCERNAREIGFLYCISCSLAMAKNNM